MVQQSVLHITPWFPSSASPEIGIWIQRHIKLVSDLGPTHVLHIDLDWGPWKLNREENTDQTKIYCRIPWRIWRLREWVFAYLMRKELIRMKARQQFDTVNFHIAYPSLVRYKWLESYLPHKKLITEHWSAYHFRFHSENKMDRLMRMFSHNIPIIAVSQSLARDIREFSSENPIIHIVPNSVDTGVFKPKGTITNSYFMAAYWAEPKQPEEVIRAWAENLMLPKLRIAGEGPKWEMMRELIDRLHLGERIVLLGSLSESEIALELSKAKGLLLPTTYETFSVIAAEALCVGCPVIANKVGSLCERLDDSNGIFKMEDESWNSALSRFDSVQWNREQISAAASSLYSNARVKQEYLAILQSL